LFPLEDLPDTFMSADGTIIPHGHIPKYRSLFYNGEE